MPAAFAAKLTNGADAVSAFLRGQLQDSVKADLATYSASSANAKAVISALVKDLNQVISGPSIYDKARFRERRSSARDRSSCCNRIRKASNWRG